MVDSENRCIVTGASGFLGREAMVSLSREYEVIGVTHQTTIPGGVCVDLRDPDAVRRLIDDVNPIAVVHLAAYRDPDFCELNPDEAKRLNIGSVKTFVDYLPKHVRLLFASSDYVFSGNHPPYLAENQRHPLNVYGATKVEAEDMVADRADGIIVRFPLLIGGGKTLAESGFIGKIIAALRRGEVLDLDAKAVRFPTWTREVAIAMASLLQYEAEGIFHVSSACPVTKYGLAMAVAKRLNLPLDNIREATDTGESPTSARPHNCQLDLDSIRRMGVYEPRDFLEVVDIVCGEFESATE